MTPGTELVRLVLSAFFATVALYCLARLAKSFSPQAIRPTVARWTTTERSSNIAHGLMSLGIAAVVSGAAGAMPPAPGMLLFGLLAAWFLVVLVRHGLLQHGLLRHRAAHRGVPAKVRGQGGYTLHHLVGGLAMVYLFATGHPGLSGAAEEAAASGTTYSAAAAHAVAIGHYSPSAGTNVSWLLGLYFLVAATSLGFRVAEPAIRVTHRAAVPVGPFGFGPAPRSTSVKLFCTPAGLCASEVVISAGMAFVFFSVL